MAEFKPPLRDQVAAVIHDAYPDGVNGWFLADMLAPLIASRQAEAWAEGFEVGHDTLPGEGRHSNPYKSKGD